MTDRELDERIERALHARAGDAPTTNDLSSNLASTARGRVHRRRNRRIGVAAALAVVATLGGVWTAVGGPETFTTANEEAGSGGSASREVAPAPNSSQDNSDKSGTGWRWESYGGVELQVPAGWGYGVARAPWCSAEPAIARQTDGEVGRPGPIGYVKCPDPVPVDRRGEHVWFSRGGVARTSGEQRDLGAGWVEVVRVVNGIEIEVQTRDPAVRDRILNSIREVTVDLNGCPATHRISTAEPIQPLRGLAWDGSVTGVSICSYVGDQQPGPGLTGSRRLAGTAAQRVLGAIRAAPPGGPDEPGQQEFLGGGTVLRFDSADGVREIFVRYDSGPHNGFDNGTSERRLTRESLTFMTGPLVVTAGPRETLTLMPRR